MQNVSDKLGGAPGIGDSARIWGRRGGFCPAWPSLLRTSRHSKLCSCRAVTSLQGNITLNKAKKYQDMFVGLWQEYDDKMPISTAREGKRQTDSIAEMSVLSGDIKQHSQGVNVGGCGIDSVNCCRQSLQNLAEMAISSSAKLALRCPKHHYAHC